MDEYGTLLIVGSFLLGPAIMSIIVHLRFRYSYQFMMEREARQKEKIIEVIPYKPSKLREEEFFKGAISTSGGEKVEEVHMAIKKDPFFGEAVSALVALGMNKNAAHTKAEMMMRNRAFKSLEEFVMEAYKRP